MLFSTVKTRDCFWNCVLLFVVHNDCDNIEIRKQWLTVFFCSAMMFFVVSSVD